MQNAFVLLQPLAWQCHQLGTDCKDLLDFRRQITPPGDAQCQRATYFIDVLIEMLLCDRQAVLRAPGKVDHNHLINSFKPAHSLYECGLLM